MITEYGLAPYNTCVVSLNEQDMRHIGNKDYEDFINEQHLPLYTSILHPTNIRGYFIKYFPDDRTGIFYNLDIDENINVCLLEHIPPLFGTFLFLSGVKRRHFFEVWGYTRTDISYINYSSEKDIKRLKYLRSSDDPVDIKDNITNREQSIQPKDKEHYHINKRTPQLGKDYASKDIEYTTMRDQEHYNYNINNNTKEKETESLGEIRRDGMENLITHTENKLKATVDTILDYIRTSLPSAASVIKSSTLEQVITLAILTTLTCGTPYPISLCISIPHQLSRIVTTALSLISSQSPQFTSFPVRPDTKQQLLPFEVNEKGRKTIVCGIAGSTADGVLFIFDADKKMNVMKELEGLISSRSNNYPPCDFRKLVIISTTEAPKQVHGVDLCVMLKNDIEMNIDISTVLGTESLSPRQSMSSPISMDIDVSNTLPFIQEALNTSPPSIPDNLMKIIIDFSSSAKEQLMFNNIQPPSMLTHITASLCCARSRFEHLNPSSSKHYLVTKKDVKDIIECLRNVLTLAPKHELLNISPSSPSFHSPNNQKHPKNVSDIYERCTQLLVDLSKTTAGYVTDDLVNEVVSNATDSASKQRSITSKLKEQGILLKRGRNVYKVNPL